MVDNKFLYAAMGYEMSPGKEKGVNKSLEHALTVYNWPKNLQNKQIHFAAFILRKCPRTNHKELIGLSTHERNDFIFKREILHTFPRYFGLNCLYLKDVHSMSPWATVKKIPASVGKIDLNVYNAYLYNFDFGAGLKTKCN